MTSPITFTRGTWALTRFFVSQLPFLRSLPAALRDVQFFQAMSERRPLLSPTGGKSDEQLHTGGPVSVEVPLADVQAYNNGLLRLKSDIKALGGTGFEYTAMLKAFFAIRLACVVVATVSPWYVTLAAMALQFVVMPYSLFVSATQLVALAPTLYAAHWLGFVALDYGVRALGVDVLYVTVTPTVVVLLLVADQLACVACTLGLHGPSPAPMPTNRLLKSVVFGFVNCKTYTIILLVQCLGLRVNVVAWVLDAHFGVTRRCGEVLSAATLHWLPLFYHQHRLAHLPRVYEQAHKLHHHLHDSTAFDAHVYGSGAPEEWFTMVFELLPAALLGVTPPTLSPHVMYTSWENKMGHTRAANCTDGSNMHCDHHTHHNKNFGIFFSGVDMLFGTMTNNDTYNNLGMRVVRTVDEAANPPVVRLVFSRED